MTTFSSEDFQTIDDVPVLCETTVRDNLGRSHVIDEQKLQEIVTKNNEVFAHEPATIIIGHTTDTDDQKPALGFMDNFRLGDRNGKATVFARFQVQRDELDQLKKYPKRSCEIYLNDLRVSAVSLLGGDRPRCDLGLLTLKESGPMVRFSMDEDEKMTAESVDNSNPTGDTMADEIAVPDELKQQILAVLEQTDVVQYIKKMMEDEKVEETKDEEVKPEESKEPEATDEAPKAEEEKKDEEEPAKLSMLAQELAEYKSKFQTVQREKVLIQLQNQGHDFDIAAELADVTDMDDQNFDKHLKRIIRFSKRAPLGRKFEVASLTNGGQPSSDILAMAKQEAITNNVPFAQALAKFTK